MKRLILLVGVPASGKTTLALALVEQGFVRLCADEIRLELYGDTTKQGDAKHVFAIFSERLEKLLGEGKNVVIDNMNAKFIHRQQIIEKAQKFEYQDVQLWVLQIPLEVCLARNKKRSRQVPEDVIISSFNTLTKYDKPEKKEGKVVIVSVDDNGKWQFSASSDQQ